VERSEREDVVGVCSYFCMSEREETEGRLGTEGLMASSVAVYVFLLVMLGEMGLISFCWLM
jgi:hypothetical protein